MTGHGRRSKERNEWREELEAEHRPKQVQRRLTERRRQCYLGDAILLPLVPFLIPNLTADTRFVASAVAAGRLRSVVARACAGDLANNRATYGPGLAESAAARC